MASKLADGQLVAQVFFGDVVVALIHVGGSLAPDHLVEADDQALVEARLHGFYFCYVPLTSILWMNLSGIISMNNLCRTRLSSSRLNRVIIDWSRLFSEL